MEIYLLYLVPVIAVIILSFLKKKFLMDIVQFVSSTLVLGISIFVAYLAMVKGSVSNNLVSGIIYLDPLGGLVLIIITIIFFLVTLYSFS
ncbi:MAG: hypothetical protein WCR27_08570, partial [Eubacteriales bacterium]